ncbi:histidine kinase [Streptomyces sp. NPDC005955]|uniref:sensor histidine kinase n=1 Tax=Streptomyces sp. NPDC005955 TaxID=3364738 RepID=UPI003690DAA4
MAASPRWPSWRWPCRGPAADPATPGNAHVLSLAALSCLLGALLLPWLTGRAGIAADMHDSLGHALSLVALRAGALELSPDLTDRDRADLAELRGTIADAVEQLRETVAVLHDPPGPDTGAGLPVHDTVEDLLTRAIASGVPVRWERRRVAPPLSPLVERGMYRVVQEALTNAVKHASDCAIRVRITHGADRTRVSVVNTASSAGGPAHAGEGPAHGAGGRGLMGLRERVTVLGGSLRTASDAGGFHVTAVLPHQADARPGAPTRGPGAEPGTPVGTRGPASPSETAPHPDGN